MRTYTITTTISPMDDSDLLHNFKKMRRKYWIKRRLWIPEDVAVVFGKIKKTQFDIGKPPAIATCANRHVHGASLFAVSDPENKIIITSEIKHSYFAVHISLLHEIAHLYIGTSTNWDRRKDGHGKTFNKEIDRLYALGAFRKLI